MLSFSSLWCRFTIKVALQANDSIGLIRALCHWDYFEQDLSELLKNLTLDAHQAKCLKLAMHYLKINSDAQSAQETRRVQKAQALLEVCKKLDIPRPRIILEQYSPIKDAYLEQAINKTLNDFKCTRPLFCRPSRQLLAAIFMVLAKEAIKPAHLMWAAPFMFISLLFHSYSLTTCFALVGFTLGLTCCTEQRCRKRLFNEAAPPHQARVGK